MAFYLGIDGGGTRTSCLLGDENSILGSGSAGGSNVVRVGEARARESFSAAILQACNSAGVTPLEITRTCAGVAGGARPQIAEAVRGILSELVSGELEIVGDMMLALEAAFAGDPGVVVIAGTGSMAYGRNTAGDTARAGGWGFAISDEGSGHWIGLAAVAAAMRDQDEGEPGKRSSLLDDILKAWSLTSLEQLVVFANASPAPDFAALFPAVLKAAQRDAIARRILTSAGGELAGLAKIVIRRLFPVSETVPVAMTGGVFGNSALVREVFYNELRAAFPKAVIANGVIEPMQGALTLARRARPQRS